MGPPIIQETGFPGGRFAAYRGLSHIFTRSPSLDPTDSDVVMHSRTRQVQIPSSYTNAAIEIPKPPPGKTAIAIIWDQGGDTNSPVDLDLYVQPPAGGPELYFGQPQSPHGRLHRDVRQSLSDSPDSWRSTWEYVELEGDALPSEVWINLYAGRGPIHGVLRVHHRGQESNIGFDLPAVLGDWAQGRRSRESSPQWLRIPIADAAGGSLSPSAPTPPLGRVEPEPNKR